MMIFKNGDSRADQSLEMGWHVGERCPPIPPQWVSLSILADGDELNWLLAKMRSKADTPRYTEPESLEGLAFRITALESALSQLRQNIKKAGEL